MLSICTVILDADILLFMGCGVKDRFDQLVIYFLPQLLIDEISFVHDWRLSFYLKRPFCVHLSAYLCTFSRTEYFIDLDQSSTVYLANIAERWKQGKTGEREGGGLAIGQRKDGRIFGSSGD